MLQRAAASGQADELLAELVPDEVAIDGVGGLVQRPVQTFRRGPGQLVCVHSVVAIGGPLRLGRTRQYKGLAGNRAPIQIAYRRGLVRDAAQIRSPDMRRTEYAPIRALFGPGCFSQQRLAANFALSVA